MTRREIREEIYKIIFSIEFHPYEELESQIEFAFDALVTITDEDRFVKGKGYPTEEDLSYIKNKVLAIGKQAEEIDARINEVVTNWRTSRMGKAELSAIRLAYYEMMEEHLTPAIVINEAVELVKKYGGEESSGFVNGVLAKLV